MILVKYFEANNFKSIAYGSHFEETKLGNTDGIKLLLSLSMMVY